MQQTQEQETQEEKTQIQTLDNNVFFAGDKGGCAFYRIEMPARVVPKTKVTTEFLMKYHPGTQELAELSGFGDDVTLIQRPTDERIIHAIRAAQQQGKRVGIELDDNVFSLSYQNPIAQLWTNEKKKILVNCMKQADFVTCSTEPLAKVLREKNKHVYHIPNAIDLLDIAPAIAQAKLRHIGQQKLKVGWAGGWTHQYDVKLLAPTIQWLARQPQVEIHFFGYDAMQPTNTTSGTYTHADITYIFHKWTPKIPDHYLTIAQLDIAFIPVIDNVFNTSKSNLKWLEHSALFTPTVSSDTPAYKNIQHAETGFKAKNEADFLKYTKLLVTRPDIRESIANAAHEAFQKNYTLESTAPLWRQAVLDNAS